MKRTYTELIQLPTFEERFKYLFIGGGVAEETFGWQRYLNQQFYSSTEWKRFRRDIILRDQCLDLGCEDHLIVYRPIIHHLNPITPEDLFYRRPCLMDPENVITTYKRTHDAIHYGDLNYAKPIVLERSPNDTSPWRIQT